MKKQSKETTSKKTKTFQTPHEKKAMRLSQYLKEEADKPTATAKKQTGQDAFGGRLGTRMSNINLVVITAGAQGATVHEVAEKTGESASIVGAQLGWMVSHKKVATRKEEKNGDGKKTFRYFSKEADSKG